MLKLVGILVYLKFLTYNSHWIRAMLELDQILRANEINFAILAALPAFFLSLGLIVVVRAWFRKVKTLQSSIVLPINFLKRNPFVYMCRKKAYAKFSSLHCLNSYTFICTLWSMDSTFNFQHVYIYLLKSLLYFLRPAKHAHYY